jgi:aminoglycoside phosphotransferase (APT) family kinase protein
VTKLHPDEVDIDHALVDRLVRAQAPQFAKLPLTRPASMGTVNTIYRLGDDLCVRLPRIEKYAESLERELVWLPRLAPRLPLRIPELIAAGTPGFGYPFTWAIYRWIDGQPWQDDLVHDETTNACTLAQFVQALRRVPAVMPGATAPPAGRRPLRQLDGVTLRAIVEAGAAIDGTAAAAVWTRALEAAPWEGERVWIHTDLLRPNLLIDDGRLAAVIDFGSAGIGDPAADVICAWSVFGPHGRAVFREQLGVDDETWARARAYALHQAVLIIPYYRDTNPGFVTLARRTVEQVLLDAPL